MIALKAKDVKAFTSKLFVKEDFDQFLVKEVQIVTYNSFVIDGHIRHGYFTDEEREEKKLGEFSPWSLLRPVCFSLIKGKKLPESFQIVLQLPERNVERFAASAGAGIDSSQIKGLYLNIRYEDGALYCVTGTSLAFFTMDKTLENEWDSAVRKFMLAHQLPCTES